MISEQELILGCKKGKSKYQKLLYEKYASRMLAICSRYFQSKDEAQDALQDGFIKVFTKIDEFRFEGSFEGWVKRIMVTTSLNLHRQNLKHYFHTDIDQEGFQLPDYSMDYDCLQLEDMMNLIQSLPNGYKIVFNLFEIEGYSHAEIAEMLDISINTSKSQLLKARKFLQKRLGVKVEELKENE